LVLRAADHISDLEIQAYSKNRIGSNKMKASVDDIMHIFQLVDERYLQDKLPTFCAVNKSRVPLLADEMSDLASIRLELCHLRQHVYRQNVLALCILPVVMSLHPQVLILKKLIVVLIRLPLV